MATEIERFWAKVDKTSSPEGCWLWTANTVRGYGRFSNRRAHRCAYELLIGPIPDGLGLDHLCHNAADCPGGNDCPHRRCVNPAHLRPVSTRTNVLRGRGFAAVNASKTQCSNGHPFDADNTRLHTSSNGRPWRQCKECAREAVRRWRRRLRAA